MPIDQYLIAGLLESIDYFVFKVLIGAQLQNWKRTISAMIKHTQKTGLQKLKVAETSMFQQVDLFLKIS